MFGIATTLHLFFNALDHVVYPEWEHSFLIIRIFDVALVTLLFLLSFTRWAKKHIMWMSDIACYVFAGGMFVMIYLTEGSYSHYYEGINFVFLGSALINSFSVRHNLGFCLAVIGSYILAVCLNPHWNTTGFISAIFFMSSTALFSILMVKFYGRQHWKAFEQNEELKQSEQQLARLYQQAETLSKTDELTQVFNRRHFFKIMRNKIETSEQNHSQFYLVIFDVDHFKHINDHFGHLAGDQVLKTISGIVKSKIRKNDDFGRLGGDEFLILLDVDRHDVLMERVTLIQQTIRATNFIFGGESYQASATFGAAIFKCGFQMNETQLVAQADEALLKMKQISRGGIHLAES